MKRLILPVLLISGFSISAQKIDDAKRLTLNEQFESSTEMFKSLVAKDPAKGDVWFYFGENLLKSENQDSAKILYSQGIQNDPTNPLNYVGMGKVERLEGDQEQSNQLFAKALQMGNNKNAEVMVRVAEALINIDKKDIPQAFTLLQKAQALEPRNAEVQLLQGDAFLENNDGTNAIKYYEEAKRLDPKSPAALLRIGQLWVRARNYQEKDGAKGALEYYQEAIALSPDFAPAYQQIGELYAMAKRYPEALENYTKYLDLTKGNIASRKKYASVLFLMKDYDAALTEIKQIQAEDSSFNVLNRLAAYSYYETKKYDEGLKAMEKFLKKQPENRIISSDYAYYGKLLSATDQDSLAILKLELAIDQDSTNYDIYSDLAGIYSKQKRHKEAIDMYLRKDAAGKAMINDYYRLGQSYYNIQEYANADSAFAKVTEGQPQLITGYLWRGRSNANLDPDSKLGLAKPYYEKIVALGEADSTSAIKNQKDLMESYKYLGFHYYQIKDYPNARIWWEKVKTINPKDQQALDALKDMKGK